MYWAEDGTKKLRSATLDGDWVATLAPVACFPSVLFSNVFSGGGGEGGGASASCLDCWLAFFAFSPTFCFGSGGGGRGMASVLCLFCAFAFFPPVLFSNVFRLVGKGRVAFVLSLVAVFLPRGRGGGGWWGEMMFFVVFLRQLFFFLDLFGKVSMLLGFHVFVYFRC